MRRPPAFFAVIPAAGRSTRMGRPKLALPFAGRTVLEHVILSLLKGGVQRVVVVTGPHAPELIPLAEAADADVLTIADGTPDMRTTVEHGLRWLQEHQLPQEGDAFFLAPGDHPAFDASLVHRLCGAYSAGHSSIVIPVHAGQRGHPVLIAWRHVVGILAMTPQRGVNMYLRENSEQIHELETDGRGVLFNLDSPDDLVALQCQETLLLDSSPAVLKNLR